MMKERFSKPLLGRTCHEMAKEFQPQLRSLMLLQILMVRTVLDFMRRGEHSVFSRIADIHDRRRDMPLDIDNISYGKLPGSILTYEAKTETEFEMMKERFSKPLLGRTCHEMAKEFQPQLRSLMLLQILMVRTVLDFMRRGEHSVFSRIADIHDRRRDMPLDIDNISYGYKLYLWFHDNFLPKVSTTYANGLVWVELKHGLHYCIITA
nr:hypothetical protein [Tanacetum cinerariifolium]